MTAHKERLMPSHWSWKARSRQVPRTAHAPSNDAGHRQLKPMLRGHALWLIAIAGFSAADGSQAGDLQFNRDIRPILSDACFRCHGPDAKKREGDLRLDEVEPATADRGGYAAIVPGDATRSEIMQRIESKDPDEQMPPPDSGFQLDPKQREVLRRWINQGAQYEKHWSFTKVVRPQPPEAGHPIDAFIRQRLQKIELPLSPLAPAETQLRRVTLDLTGLPPSLAEIDSYLADVTRLGVDQAYAKVVDRLLKSTRYGERMAWDWMEAARYADTNGYQNDGPRTMWRWRDWVIDAFTRGMPFDQFTIEQLAGDQLENPTHEQLIATAFHRNNRYNGEEGIPIDEFLLENAVDRVDTTATVWMGLTIGCARCHDHKYDPINQKEYYQLVDYFNDVAESGRAKNQGNSDPWLITPTDEQRLKLASLESKVKEAERALMEAEPQLAAAQQDWESAGGPLEPIIADGLTHFVDFEEKSHADLVATQLTTPFSQGRSGLAATVDGQGSLQVGKVAGLIGNRRFSMAFWMKPDDVERGAVLSSEANNTNRSGILVEFVEGRLRWNIITRWIGGVSTIETKRQFKPGEWVHVALTNDGTKRARGMCLYVDGQLQDVEIIRDTNSNDGKAEGALMTIGRSKYMPPWAGQIDDLRCYAKRTLDDREVGLLACDRSLESIRELPRSQRTEVEAAALRQAFLEHGAIESLARLLDDLRQAKSAFIAYYDKLPTTMIVQDLAEPRPSYVRVRGVYDQLGEKVTAGVPAIFPSLPADQKNNRLALAKWLVSSEHPLTARVVVNRYWQMLFGVGLVKTTEDFGSQGEPPTHPELLDWLAAEFMEHGWSTPHLLKTIVMSHTYRQSSNVTPEHREKDPANVWYARAPRLSLNGSVLRDQALFLSGLLVEKIGGPSVFPYQPERLWEEASNAKYKVGEGEDLYRRSLYSYWKRTLAPPTMAVLDTADREYCSVKPRRTNTPLQALTLLNEVTFVEAARKFAERLLDEGGDDDRARIQHAFRSVTARQPAAAEVELLLSALQNYRQSLADEEEQAKALLSVGSSAVSSRHSPTDLAAYTALANVLLNLEEVTTRE